VFRYIICFLSFVFVFHCGFAQSNPTRKISFRFEGGRLQDFLALLEKKAGCNFSFEDKIIEHVSIGSKVFYNQSVKEIIKPILKENGLKIKTIGQNNILIYHPKKRKLVVGYIYDLETGEQLAGAEIYLTNKQQTIPSNNYGYFQISTQDSIKIDVRYVGYKSKEVWLTPGQKETKIGLVSLNILDNVWVFNKENQRTLEHQSLNKISIYGKGMAKVPQAFGHDDILQSLQMMPGIQANINCPTGLSVRGGNPDQNQYLLDDIQIFNPTHILGFVSAFSTNSLQKLTLLKGDIPAEYGGNLSSVFALQSKKGNTKRRHFEAQIGLLSADILAEGPLKRNSDKTTFSFSARRSYLDLLLGLPPVFQNKREISESLGYYFYDVSLGIHHKVDERNKLSLQLFTQNDKGFYETEFRQSQSAFEEVRSTNLNWYGLNGGITWNHQFNNGAFLNTVVSHSERKISFANYVSFNFAAIDTLNSTSQYAYNSLLIQNAVKSSLDILVINNYVIKTGFGVVHRQFSPQNNQYYLSRAQEVIYDSSYKSFQSSTLQPYFFIENKIYSKHFQTNLGIRQDFFRTDNQTWTSYWQPRIGFQYSGFENWVLNMNYSKIYQFVHQIPNNTTGIPIDLWIPANQTFGSSSMQEFALGLLFKKKKYNYSIQAYHRSFDDVLEYKNESGIFVHTNSLKTFASGEGRAFGIECLAQKNIGKLQGWISYTLSKSDRQFDELNQGKRFLSKYHRAHNLGIFLNFPLTNQWFFSTNWQWISGNFISLPTVHYNLRTPSGKVPIHHLQRRNNFQLRDYNSLNVSFKKNVNKSWGMSEWTFSLFNVYGYPNPMYAYFGINAEGKTVLKQRSFFRFLPGVQYAIKFK